MPYGIGGLADKFGNRYESRWLVELLIRLSREQILSVIHESVDADGIDLQLCNIDGIKEFHQCKGRNAGKDYWTLSALNSHNIFSYARKQLDSDERHIYKLISPRPCDAMETLIMRAKNSPDDPMKFYESQIKAIHGINSADIEMNFHKFQEYMGLPPDDTPSSIVSARDYLMRMEFVLLADTEYVKTQLTDRISDIYSSDSKGIYDIFVNYTIDNNRLGHTITIGEINNFLSNRNIYMRDLSNNSQIWSRTQELNREFAASFIPIGGKLFNRQETEIIYKLLHQNTSVILHGKAGSGKSGCVQGLMTKLEKEGIPYLALKLDKNIPEKSADIYGKDLGFSASPVLCLSRIACGTTGILILDQLDAVRWTSQHTRTALDVCKEMVAQAERLSFDTYFGGNVSILFVCRTFDVENDSGIISLFTNDNKSQNKMHWDKVPIGDLAEPDIIKVTGALYTGFTAKFQRLLKNANNLYIWSRLDDERKKIEYASNYHLIKGYWKQFQHHCEAQGIPHTDILGIRNTLVSVMRTSRMTVPLHVLRDCSDKAIDLAVSEGFIIRNDRKISFVHQSFYDAFVVENMADELFNGKKLIDLLGSKDEQTPQLRYQLQMLLQILAEEDQPALAQCGSELLDCESVRHYMKYVLWEVIGQLTNIENALMALVESCLDNPIWSPAIIESIIKGHPFYVLHFIDSGLIQAWLQSDKMDDALNLLCSVCTNLGDQIVNVLMPYAFKNGDMDVKIYHTLDRKPEDETDNQFAFRLRLLACNPILWENHINFKVIIQKIPHRAAQLLECMLKMDELDFNESTGGIINSDPKLFENLGETIPETIWNIFMPIIEEKTIGEYSFWDSHMRGWSAFDVSIGVGRCVVRMAITAGKKIAEMRPELYYFHFMNYTDSKSKIINEILLYTMAMLPEQYSDEILKWLISDSFSHINEKTGKYEKSLEAARLLIEKYSLFCSDATFKCLEASIMSYQDKMRYAWAKDDLKFNQEARKKGHHPIDDFMVGYAYWGQLQVYLLPALDERRTSSHTKQLIQLLQRRFEGYDLGGVKSRITTGWSGVLSPISGVISDQFSDKQWLKLIKSMKLQSKGLQGNERCRCRPDKSSHQIFARQYTHAGLKNPERFVQLALRFPADVDRHYLQAVWEIASTTEAPDNTENWKPADIDTVCKVIEKYLPHHDADEYNTCCGFSRLIRNRANEDWNEIVITHLIYLATEYDDQHLRDDSSDFGTESLNCVRGSAANALSSLLWENSKYYKKLQPVIDRLVQDEHAVVRQAILEAVIAVYNIDREQSVRWFFALVDSDERIARHYRAKVLYFHIWNQHKIECADVIQRLFISEDPKSSEFGAFMASNLFIIYVEDTEIFQKLIFSGVLTEEQIKGCATVAVDLMEDSHCHDRAKIIVDELANYHVMSSEPLNMLFYRDSFVLSEDHELMKKVASLHPGVTILSLNHYICEHDLPALDFIDIVAHICNQLKNNINNEAIYKRGYYSMIHDLPTLVSKIYDQATGNKETISTCLDMWDALYQCNVGNIREITQQIMDK